MDWATKKDGVNNNYIISLKDVFYSDVVARMEDAKDINFFEIMGFVQR